ncbi:MAG TPA: hypothetical protein VF721_22395 [Pyrinomonadaceae bacterium]|jgi:hypothetical protein
MKKNKQDAIFRFGIVEENDKDLIIEITEEDYQKQIAAGIPEDELLPAGFHKARRGGFHERHPDLSLENVEIKITKSGENAARSIQDDNEKKAA